VRLLFLHGWGFDASLWDRLRRELAPLPSSVWDRGYFGRARREPVAGPVLAIGHSLGSLILAADPPPGCVGLVAINGFDRFSGDGAVPGRVIDRMRRRLATAPREVLDAFRIRCGAALFEGAIDERSLADDLDLLAAGDARGTARPLQVLHGAADPILPTEMRTAVFAGAPRETASGGGHLLPLTHPDWCAAMIRTVLP